MRKLIAAYQEVQTTAAGLVAGDYFRLHGGLVERQVIETSEREGNITIYSRNVDTGTVVRWDGPASRPFSRLDVRS